MIHTHICLQFQALHKPPLSQLKYGRVTLQCTKSKQKEPLGDAPNSLSLINRNLTEISLKDVYYFNSSKIGTQIIKYKTQLQVLITKNEILTDCMVIVNLEIKM